MPRIYKLHKPISNCIVCDNTITRNSKAGTNLLRRANWSVTGCRRCSRIYNKIEYFLWSRMKTKIKNNILTTKMILAWNPIENKIKFDYEYNTQSSHTIRLYEKIKGTKGFRK
jgi:transposase